MIIAPNFDFSNKLQPGAIKAVARAWRREQGIAHRATAVFCKRLALASTASKAPQGLVRAFLRDPQVRLSAALSALGQDPDRSAAIALRNKINPWAPGEDVVTWYSKRKDNGSSRTICELPLVLSAIHFLLAKAIEAQLQPNAEIYAVKNKGRDEAAKELKALQNSGFIHLAKVDIVSCFQSINPDALYQLPLPKEVIKQSLDTRNLSFSRRERPSIFAGMHPRDYYARHNPSAPQGLIQGSPVSGCILAWLLNNLPKTMDAHVLLYSDNFAVAARDPEITRATIIALTDYLRQCPGGPLVLCPPVFADAEPMEFLGYLFDPTRSDIGLSERAYGKLEKRLGPEEEKFSMGQGKVPLAIWQVYRSFASGFAAIENMERELAGYLALTEESLAPLQSSIINTFHRSLFAPLESADRKMVDEFLALAGRQTK